MVPDAYRDKHMSDKMREQSFPLFFHGRLCTVRILAKIERSVSPRDVAKLRERLDLAITYLTPTRPFDEMKTYNKMKGR